MNNYKEAFCLMQYRDEVTGEIEILWNSRDGVTPFGIRSKAGNVAFHINWHQDVYQPDFVPVRGMRIFIDASPDYPHIQEQAKRYVDRFWNAEGIPLSMHFRLKEDAIKAFVEEWTKPGTPTVVEAGEPGTYVFPMVRRKNVPEG